jgi:hypothetical protein
VSKERETPRKRVWDAMQDSTDGDEEIHGAILTGFVLVAEWMDGDGQRWLSLLHGSNGGESDAPEWQRQGYLHNALYEWPTQDEEE